MTCLRLGSYYEEKWLIELGFPAAKYILAEAFLGINILLTKKNKISVFTSFKN